MMCTHIEFKKTQNGYSIKLGSGLNAASAVIACHINHHVYEDSHKRVPGIVQLLIGHPFSDALDVITHSNQMRRARILHTGRGGVT